MEDFDPRVDAADNYAEEIAEREEALADAIARGDEATAMLQRRMLAQLRAGVRRDPETQPELEPETPEFVTIFALAEYRLKQLGRTVSESLTGQDFHDVKLQIMGGCADCGASLAAYNAYPSRRGFWLCEDDIGDEGWTDVATADREIRAMEAIV